MLTSLSPLLRVPRYEVGVDLPARRLLAPHRHLYPRVQQRPYPPAAHARVRVHEPDDDAAHARVHERSRARRRPTEVVARLEGDVRGGAARGVASRAQREHLIGRIG